MRPWLPVAVAQTCRRPTERSGKEHPIRSPTVRVPAFALLTALRWWWRDTDGTQSSPCYSRECCSALSAISPRPCCSGD
jgi:hypothetical protein